MLITNKWLEDHATCNGVGWTRAQVEAIGGPWPLNHGWKRRTIGRVITNAQAREFERLGALRRQTLAKQTVENDLHW